MHNTTHDTQHTTHNTPHDTTQHTPNANPNSYVVDGFPRTAVQVDFVKLLFDKMTALHLGHDAGPLAVNFPRPSFKVGRRVGV